MDRDHDMDHIRGAASLRATLQTTNWPSGVYGDTIGGKSFNEAESNLLLKAQQHNRPEAATGWREVWHMMTCWTIIDCSPESPEQRELRLEIEAEIKTGGC